MSLSLTELFASLARHVIVRTDGFKHVV